MNLIYFDFMKLWPSDMTSFYLKNHLKKSGEGPGGQFNWPSITFILQESSILNLYTFIENCVNSVKFFDYLRTITDLHSVCMVPTVPEEREEVLADFWEKCDALHYEFNLSETLKIYVIKYHYMYYFNNMRKTFIFTESAQSFRINT